MKDKLISFKSGNIESFKDIHNYYYQKIYILCLKILNNHEDAIDATQETFIQVFKSVDTLNDIEKFNAWINKVAISKCSYIIRKNKNYIFISDGFDVFQESDEITPETMLCEDEKKKIILEAIGNLALKKRVVLTLYYYNELKINEISDVLGIPIGTVKSRLNSAKKDLKKEFIRNNNSIKLYQVTLPALLLLIRYDFKYIINIIKLEYRKKKIRIFKKIIDLRLNLKRIYNKLSDSSILYKICFGLGILLIISSGIYKEISTYEYINKVEDKNIEDIDNKVINTEKVNDTEEDSSPQILGIEDITIKLGEDFDITKNVYVKDDIDKEVDAYAEGYVDTNKEGIYIIKYIAIDKSNNKVEIERKVTVIN